MSYSNPVYLGLGTSLLGMSFLTMSMILEDEEVRRFINTQLNIARMHAALLVLITLYMYVIGIVHSIFRNDISREFMILGVGLVWTGFFIVELSSIVTLHRAGFRPRVSKKLLDMAVYFAIFWLIMERIDLDWIVVQAVTTIFMVVTFYFLLMLKRYMKIVAVLPEPMDLYLPALGLRVITAIAGLSMATYGHSEGAFKGLIALAYLILAIIFWHSAMEMERIVRIEKSF